MSLKDWAAAKWTRPHKTSRQEIGDLWAIAVRDLRDAKAGGISEDWQFGICYNAALKLCTILLYAEGYRMERNLAHYRTLESLPLILGTHKAGDAAYLQACLTKRNNVEYDRIGGATKEDVTELIEFTGKLMVEVLAWLQEKHPKLSPE